MCFKKKNQILFFWVIWRMNSIRVSSLLTQHCRKNYTIVIVAFTPWQIQLSDCVKCHLIKIEYISKSFISSHPSIIQTDLGESYNYLQSLKSTSLCSDQTMKTWCDIFWCLSHSYVFFYINRLSSCQRTRLT